MNKRNIRSTLICVMICLLISFIFVGCGPQRDYYDDIYIPLQDSSEKIIIKEWSYLLGSGAEVYYQKNDSKPIKLGNTTGGDDGFCPFNEGFYEISQDGSTVIIKWCFKPSNKDKTNWRSMTFELPE